MDEDRLETGRLVIPGAERLLRQYWPVLDHGFVALVDYMGGDASVEEAARVSFGSAPRGEDKRRTLLRHLRRHRHTSPSEQVELKFHCAMPIFVARQWVRHRTACLAGDVRLSFDLPGGVSRRGNQHYTLTVREVFDRWQPTEAVSRPDKQGDALHKRTRVRAMMLRSVNEETREVQHTRIVDVWSSGIKDVYEVTFSGGQVLRATLDHRCFTEAGWMTLGDALEAGVGFVGVGKRRVVVPPSPAFTDVELVSEAWRAVAGYDGYEVSDLGRVRSWRNTVGAVQDVPKVKILTPMPGGHLVVSLSAAGVSRTRLVHHLVLEAFVGLAVGDVQTRHLDSCPSNNRVGNLAWGTAQDNADDRMGGTGSQRLGVVGAQVLDVQYIGRHETFDLEVEGPFHNFVAGGVVVHNSLNEVSGRYSLLPMLFYTPTRDVVQRQAATNKQGRAGDAMAVEEYEVLVSNWAAGRAGAQDQYEELCANGMARELARIDLPLSTYTQWYWKIDLHNLLHFLSLRCDSHSQHEVRAFADVLAAVVREVAPQSFEAWVDYDFCAARFSRAERTAMRRFGILDSSRIEAVCRGLDMTAREVAEFTAKLTASLDPPTFPALDPADARTGEHFRARCDAATPTLDKPSDV